MGGKSCQPGRRPSINSSRSTSRGKGGKTLRLTTGVFGKSKAKGAEEAPREREEFCSVLLSNAPNPVVVINADASVRYVNPTFEEQTGFSSNEVIGTKPPYRWWTEETLQRTRMAFGAALQKGVRKSEQLFQRQDGERFWVEITSTAVKRDGMLQYYLSSWVDITERRRADENLRERIKQLGCLCEISKLKDAHNNSLDEFLWGAVELIPLSWQYPEITCARIRCEERVYQTDNFRETRWKQSADIKIHRRKVGAIEVAYLEERPSRDEGSFLKEERALIDTLAREVGKEVQHRKAEKALEAANSRLKTEHSALKAKNIALKEILGQIESEKGQVALQVQANINRIVMPISRKLMRRVGSIEREYISLLNNCLTDITSPLAHKLEVQFGRLSPREIEICNMIRNGLSCKEVASILDVSVHTVLKQRQRIRKKLGIANSRVNLSSHLQAM